MGRTALVPGPRSSALKKCVFYSFLTAFLSFIWLIIMNGGTFTLCGDYNAQAVPFTIGMHKAIVSGTSWSWGVDLGTQTVGAYSFYGLGSISFWITMLFPVSAAPCLLGWLYILKYTAAGVTSFLYIRQFTRDENYAVVGALLYAFSGFQAVNLEFYTFHDVTLLFPVLLIGFDRMMKSGKCRLGDGRLFIAATALCCLNSYYFFIGQAVFLILYFFIRYGKKDIRLTLQNLILCGVAGLWGVLIASVLFIPNILFITGNKRSSVQFVLSRLFPEPKELLYLIKGFLLPGEAMYDSSAVINRRWTSTSAYLPLIGMSGVIAYLHGRRKDWLSRMLRVLLIIAVSPLLTSMFLLFTEDNQRWFYMLILMMAAASALVLEREKESENGGELKRAILINIALIAVFYAALNLMKWKKNDTDTLVFHRGFFLLITAFAVLGLILLYRLSSAAKRFCRAVTAWTIVFSFLSTGYVLGYYRFADGVKEQYTAKLELYSQLDAIDDQYRYIDENMMLCSKDASGLRIFSSTVSNSIVQFDSLFDFYKQARRLDKTAYAGLAELLGGRYNVTDDPGDDTPVRTYTVRGKTYYVVEKNACPIGFAVDQVITEEDLKTIDVSQRGVVLLDAAVVKTSDLDRTGEDAEEVSWSDALTQIRSDADEIAERKSAGLSGTELDPEDNAGTVYDSDQEGYSESGRKKSDLSNSKPGKKAKVLDEDLQAVTAKRVAENTDRSVKNFSRTRNGFVCSSDYDEDELVYFSVPDDSGWTAYIDGEETPIIDSGGMMLIHVPSGTHSITFRYQTPGLETGAAVSGVSLAALIVFAICGRRRKRREASECGKKKQPEM